MSDILALMAAENWESTTFESSKSEDHTTFESSSNMTSDDFVNVTGLPEKMMGLTIFELVKNYGGPMQLEKWAKVLNQLSSTTERQDKMKERRNITIEKDFVISNVFKYLDIFMDAVFDSAEAQNEIIISHVKSDPEEAKKAIPEMRKKAYTKIAKEAKKGIKDALKRLRNKYDDQSD